MVAPHSLSAMDEVKSTDLGAAGLPALSRILVVEDDPDIQMVAGMGLRAVGGFTVELASSGAEAIQIAPEFKPDLILLDVMMPEMDGISTFKALQDLPAVAAVPVVFLTAKVQTHEVSQYRQLGAVDVIAKPFDPMTLPSLLHQIWTQIHA